MGLHGFPGFGSAKAWTGLMVSLHGAVGVCDGVVSFAEVESEL